MILSQIFRLLLSSPSFFPHCLLSHPHIPVPVNTLSQNVPPPPLFETPQPPSPPASHNNSNVIIHKRINVPQEATRDDTDHPKRDTDQIYIPITFRIRNLARSDNRLVRHLSPQRRVRHSWDRLDLLEQTGAREGDSLGNSGAVDDAQLELHGAADVVLGIGHEFVVEDVVVDRVADRPADDADGEGQGGDGGDEVVWADDGGDDTSGDDDATDAKSGENQQAPGAIERVCV